MVRASAVAEQSGLRSVSLITTGFVAQARSTATALGAGHLAIAEYPGRPETDDDGTMARNVAESLVPQILEGLTREAQAAVPAQPGPAGDRRQVVFTGTLEAIQDEFHRRLWSDGLPVIPPTPAAVERFLAGTDRSADEVLAVLPPTAGEASVWSVAVNAVMAGCRPEYMPLLIALVEAVADPAFRLQDAGSTPGWEALVTVNGPIRERLDFNHGGGVLRPGRQANTSIGRFLRLFMRNAAGLRTPPGQLDKACIGAPMGVVLAEDDETCAALGWPTLAETLGYGPEDDVVTVQSVVLGTPPIYTSGVGAEQHLAGIADVFARTASPWTVAGLRWGGLYPLLVMSPYIASALARDGIGKADVAAYLHQRARVRFGSVLDDIRRAGGEAGFRLDALAEAGVIPSVYGSAGPDDLVPVFPWQESIGLVVAGDGARNQSRGYVSNHVQGSRVSRPVGSERRG